MIGTGVFTSVGFQLSSVQNTWSILLLWILGGILAMFGAFAYAELSTRFPASGGDYIYLSRVFHPLLGYLSAWAGLTVGFSAPVALAAMAMTKYLAPFGLQGNTALAITIIIGISLMHSFTIQHSSRFHDAFTVLKVVFIIVLIMLGLVLPGQAEHALLFDQSWQKEITTPGFAVAMVYVAFAYTGWNATAYITEEIDQPRRNIPRSLVYSTLFVAVLYVLLQLTILKNGSVARLEGKEEVTFIAFRNLLGETGGKWVSIFIALQLIATISSYLWVGPRVTHAMAREYRLWQIMSIRNQSGIPVTALWLHCLISIALTLTGSFETVLLYAGFVLQLMSSMTVATSLFIGREKGDFFKTPYKPWPQLIFLAFNAWVLIFMLLDRPMESLAGLGILATGAILYFFDRKLADFLPVSGQEKKG